MKYVYMFDLNTGAVVYIKREFLLENQPTLEGLIVAMSLIGATIITTFSGHVIYDLLGRKPMLIISSLFYFLGGLVMFWSPNVWILLLGPLLYGFGVGLAVTLIPILSETTSSEIRGQLNTPHSSPALEECSCLIVWFFS